MWLLLCLEILHGQLVSCHMAFVVYRSTTFWLLLLHMAFVVSRSLHCDCFCCTWLLLYLEILHADWFLGRGVRWGPKVVHFFFRSNSWSLGGGGGVAPRGGLNFIYWYSYTRQIRLVVLCWEAVTWLKSQLFVSLTDEWTSIPEEVFM